MNEALNRLVQMKEKRVKVAIVGAGTSGMMAFREVSKRTQEVIIINAGSYGTTCARVGCMPSKLFIQAANDFYRRHKFDELGIKGSESLKVDLKQVFSRVRLFRDRFVGHVLKTVESWGDQNINGIARFVEPGVLRVNDIKILAENIIIACGGTPLIRKPWMEARENLLTTDEFFEQSSLPSEMLVLGSGVIGLELGQAINRLGIRAPVVGANLQLSGLTDPDVNEYAAQTFKSEFELHLGKPAELKKTNKGVKVKFAENNVELEKVLVAIGRKLNVDSLELKNSGLDLDENGQPIFDSHSMQIGDSRVFIAGDITGERGVLHEAADEGRIAGFNALQDEPKRFVRRTPLSITFTDPNIAICGMPYSEIKKRDHIVGEVDFEGQGRALVAAKNTGLMRLYAEPEHGRLLGAQMIAPAAEHMAHLISWAIQKKMTAAEMLAMPYYHPVLEEGLRTAVRSLKSQVKQSAEELEVPPCEMLETECLGPEFRQGD